MSAPERQDLKKASLSIFRKGLPCRREVDFLPVCFDLSLERWSGIQNRTSSEQPVKEILKRLNLPNWWKERSSCSIRVVYGSEDMHQDKNGPRD